MSERSPEEQARLDSIIEGMGPLPLFAAMQDCFSTRRAFELMGWAVAWGLIGVESVKDMRRRYKEAGLTKTASYHAATDFQVFGTYLLENYDLQLSTKEILQLMVNGSVMPNKA